MVTILSYTMGPRLQAHSSDKFVVGIPQLKLIEDFRRLSESSEKTGDLGTPSLIEI